MKLCRMARDCSIVSTTLCICQPRCAQTFAIPEERLIELAKELFAKDAGVGDESLLAPDFRFEFPVISLDREVGGDCLRAHWLWVLMIRSA